MDKIKQQQAAIFWASNHPETHPNFCQAKQADRSPGPEHSSFFSRLKDRNYPLGATKKTIQNTTRFPL